VANACREAVNEGGARDGFNANSAIRILLPDHLEAMWDWIDILGYGPDAGDDSGRVVVQPRAIAARTRSL